MYKCENLQSVFCIPVMPVEQSFEVEIHQAGQSGLPAKNPLYVFLFEPTVRLVDYIERPFVGAVMCIHGPSRSGKSSFVRQFCARMGISCSYYDARVPGFNFESMQESAGFEETVTRTKVVHLDNADALEESELQRIVDIYSIHSGSKVRLVVSSSGSKKLNMKCFKYVSLQSLSLAEIKASLTSVVSSYKLEGNELVQANSLVSTIVEVIGESQLDVSIEVASLWLTEALALLKWKLVQGSVFEKALNVVFPMVGEREFSQLKAVTVAVVQRKLSEARAVSQQ
ncbi:ATP-binding protein [Vibrio owensii]|uniref:ATP-binding protein n=1 Tax=Vibrio owensii TaxID=696485 RepID=UPI0018F18D32|nr:ATP-binding protein [Vibrio owensii]